MESNQEPNKEPAFTFRYDGERPLIPKYSTNPAFAPNDRVFIRAVGSVARRGPFTVSSTQGGYKLEDDQGNPVDEGKLFEEKDLEMSQDLF